jgi:hypothetical protein
MRLPGKIQHYVLVYPLDTHICLPLRENKALCRVTTPLSRVTGLTQQSQSLKTWSVGAPRTSTDMLKSGLENEAHYQTLLDDWNSTPTKCVNNTATLQLPMDYMHISKMDCLSTSSS